MKRLHIFSLALATFLVLAGAVIAGNGRTDDASLVAPAIGSAIADFSLPGTDGKIHTLNSLKGKNGSVLILFRFSARSLTLTTSGWRHSPGITVSAASALSA